MQPFYIYRQSQSPYRSLFWLKFSDLQKVGKIKMSVGHTWPSVIASGQGLLGRVPNEKCGLDPTSRPGVDPTLDRVPTSRIILGRTHFSSNVGPSLHTRMSVWPGSGNINIKIRSQFQYERLSRSTVLEHSVSKISRLWGEGHTLQIYQHTKDIICDKQ